MMVMAFLLVVIVDGTTVSTPDMLFENIYEFGDNKTLEQKYAIKAKAIIPTKTPPIFFSRLFKKLLFFW